MTPHNSGTILKSVLSAPLLLGLMVIPVGCGSEEEAPPPPRTAAPKPREVRISEIAGMLTLNPKVNASAATQSGCSEDELRAVLQFASDFAAGDTEALDEKMDPLGRKVLSNLVANGDWLEAIEEDLQELKVVDCRQAKIGGSSSGGFGALDMNAMQNLGRQLEKLAMGASIEELDFDTIEGVDKKALEKYFREIENTDWDSLDEEDALAEITRMGMEFAISMGGPGAGSVDATLATFSLVLSDGETLEMQWALRQRGDLWEFSPYAELPDAPPVQEEVAEEEGTEKSTRGRSRSRSRSRDRPSNDPRRRVPGGPEGPGGN